MQYSISFLAKGGILVIPIIFCSILVLTVIMERLYRFHQAKLKDPGFISTINTLLENEKIEEALSLSENADNPIARVLTVGLAKYKERQGSRDLAVALPTRIAYNYFVGRVNDFAG